MSSFYLMINGFKFWFGFVRISIFEMKKLIFHRIYGNSLPSKFNFVQMQATN